MRKIVLLLFIITTLSYYNSFGFNIIKEDSVTSATFSFVGDLMCHSSQFNFAKNDSGFNFDPVYKYVKKYLSESDFAIGNLETVLGGDSVKYRGYPLFNTPDEYISALKYAGFDMLITANNHALDLGQYGLERTIRKIREKGLMYSGTFLNEDDRDSIKIFEINGIRTSVLSYTFGTNGNYLPKDNSYMINMIDFEYIKEDIYLAQKKSAELIILYLHFGDEYSRTPNNFQKQVVDSCIKYGANIIIGSHPHVVQTKKIIKSENGNVFVAYSLGNFISNQRWRYSNGGVILKLKAEKNLNTNKISVSFVDYIPTYVFKGKTKIKNEFIIVPNTYYLTSPIYQFYNDSTYNEMFESFNDTKSILTEKQNKQISAKILTK